MTAMVDANNTQPIRRAVGGVMYRRTRGGRLKLLLIKKVAGSWTLPKGHLKADETELAALDRELDEETGVRGAVEAHVDEVLYPVDRPAGPQLKLVRYYLVRCGKARLRAGTAEGIRKVRWFDPADALQRIRNERVLATVVRALNLLEAEQRPTRPSGTAHRERSA